MDVSRAWATAVVALLGIVSSVADGQTIAESADDYFAIDRRAINSSAFDDLVTPVAWGGGARRASWNVSAGGILLDRSPGRDARLVERQFGAVEVINARQFDYGWAAGPRVNLRREGQFFDLEVAHFDVQGWSGTASVATPGNLQSVGNPNIPNDGLIVFTGGFRVDVGSSLYSTEFNVGKRWTDNIRLIGGFRWIEFQDRLLVLGTFAGFPDYRDTDFNAHNHLYGGQLGADVRVFTWGRMELNSVVKAGFYGNRIDMHGERSDGAFKQTLRSTEAAFCGDVNLNARYQLLPRVWISAGYQLLWLDGIAYASTQTNTFVAVPPPTSTLSTGSSFFAQGATMGIEARF